MERAVRMLAQREHSAAELGRKLRSKGVAAPVVNEVLEDLQTHDLQSDERFTESFVHSRLRKGYGPVRIRQELSERGIGESVAEEALTRPAEFWLDIAEQARRKRFGELPASGDGDNWNAQARFLSRRGFPSDLIFTVLGARD